MNIPKQQEQSIEERIGSMIGKIMVLALIAFFVWGYGSTLAAKLGLFGHVTGSNPRSRKKALYAGIRYAPWILEPNYCLANLVRT